MKKELPKCGRTEKVFWCYCGKCTPENYSLPDDLKECPNHLIAGHHLGYNQHGCTASSKECHDFCRGANESVVGQCNCDCHSPIPITTMLVEAQKQLDQKKKEIEENSNNSLRLIFIQNELE